LGRFGQPLGEDERAGVANLSRVSEPRSLTLAESLEWALESRSSSVRVVARVTLTLDAWSASIRGPTSAARRRAAIAPPSAGRTPLLIPEPDTGLRAVGSGAGEPAWTSTDLAQLPPLRAAMASSLALVTLGTVAVVSHYPVEPSTAVIRLAPTHVVLADPPPSPPPPPTTTPPTTAPTPPPTAPPAVATAATPTTSPVIRPPTTQPALSLSSTAGGVWAALRQCESGGNYQENTGNGFYGAYQFSASTWTALGYPGRPDQEPPAMQDQAAQKLQAQSGWGQWPACSRKLGLT
jgi:hypothetical protein